MSSAPGTAAFFRTAKTEPLGDRVRLIFKADPVIGPAAGLPETPQGTPLESGGESANETSCFPDDPRHLISLCAPAQHPLFYSPSFSGRLNVYSHQYICDDGVRLPRLLNSFGLTCPWEDCRVPQGNRASGKDGFDAEHFHQRRLGTLQACFFPACLGVVAEPPFKGKCAALVIIFPCISMRFRVVQNV